MKRKELLALPALRVTNYMMRSAHRDVIRKWNDPFTGKPAFTPRFQFECYVRAAVFGKYLKVAIYYTEHMRTGSRDAVYEIFVDRDAEQYITYNRITRKWQTGKISSLSLPRSFYRLKSWISWEDDETIRRHIDCHAGGMQGILEYQELVLEKRRIRRYKKETDPWDEDLTQIPPIPKDWFNWCSKVGIPENYIFYKYDRKGTKTGFCTYCEREVPIRNPRHNQQGCCPRCRRPIVFKSEGKAGNVNTQRAYMHLIQRCRDGIVIRMFKGSRLYRKGAYRNCELFVHEERRVIYDPACQTGRAYYWGLYKQHVPRWVRGSLDACFWIGDMKGKVYGKTLPSLANQELRYTGLHEVIKCIGMVDPERYLEALHRAPILEQLAKARLGGLAFECMCKPTEWSNLSVVNGSLAKSLGIDRQEMRRLREKQGGSQFLQWLHYEKESGQPIPDDAIEWFCRQRIAPEELRFLQGRMSAAQVCRYLRRQLREPNMRKMGCRQLLTTWADYLSMATRLHMDTHSESVYRVKNLKARHDDLIAFFHNNVNLALQAGRVLQSYPHVEEILASVKDKYEFADETFAVRVPQKIEEILMEGQILSHCVGDSERYWERMERRESYVLFLRRTSAIDAPYYTLEVEPNGTIRQKRTLGDDQKDDIQEAKKFLMKWQSAVAKRLTDSDRALARVSKALRLQEFKELQEDQVRVRTGKLAGRLLLEVLQDDLLEAA